MKEVIDARESHGGLGWVVQLDVLLCRRFQDLQHKIPLLREEIVQFVENILSSEPPGKDMWDMCRLIWLLLEEWRKHSNPSCRFHEPPPQSVYLIHIGSIQSLLYLSRTSDLPDWEHAIHCAESLSRIFHSAININDQSFEQTLMESGVSRPEGAPPPIEVPLMSLCESCVRSVHGLNKGVQTLGLHIESHDNIAQLRPHDSWTTLKQHNWNMAQKLSQTQQELNEAKRALGI